jgi:hypothetical protein
MTPNMSIAVTQGQRVVLDYCNDGDGDYSVGDHACTADLVNVDDTGPFISNTTHWSSWLRSTVGIREEYANGNRSERDQQLSGSNQEFLFQPKGSVTFGPWYDTEFYVSAGKGFHSDDIEASSAPSPCRERSLPSVLCRCWREPMARNSVFATPRSPACRSS